MAILLLVRLPVFGAILMELNDFRVIVGTAKRMFSPFLTVLFSLYLVIMMFKEVGMWYFGGLIRFSDVDSI